MVKRQDELISTVSGKLTPDTLIRDLGFDSLELVELVMALEEKVDINLPDDVMGSLDHSLTIGELIRILSPWTRPKGD